MAGIPSTHGTSHYIENIIKHARNRLSHSLDNYIRQRNIQRRDKKIAKLEQEYHYLMTSWPRNVVRLSGIISALGRLWNDQVRDEPKEALAEGDGAQDMGLLQMVVTEIVREGKDRMARAKSKEEIYEAFVEGWNKVRSLLDE